MSIEDGVTCSDLLTRTIGLPGQEIRVFFEASGNLCLEDADGEFAFPAAHCVRVLELLLDFARTHGR